MTGYDIFDQLQIEELFLLSVIGDWNVECATVNIEIEGRPSINDLKPQTFSDWAEEVLEFFQDILSDDVVIRSSTIWCREGWIEFKNGSWQRFSRPELPERWR